jgi:hypothetical protein
MALRLTCATLGVLIETIDAGVVMKAKTSVVAFGLLIISVVPASLFAKGRTLKITIKGAGLTAPLEITGPEIEQFAVWAGPGTWHGDAGMELVEGREGFIVDWSKGVVGERPTGLQHYEVSFYTGCTMDEFGCRSSAPSLSYLVFYDYDPSALQGFVYLPGKDDEAFRLNRGNMVHGHRFEGNWAYATSAWENFVRPRIAKARGAGPSD